MSGGERVAFSAGTIATGPEYPPDTPVRFLLSAGVDTPVGLGATVWLYAHAKPSGLPG